MNSLVSILCLIINNSLVKDTDYYIALYILKNLYKMGSMSLNELADACHTSVPTVKKFIRTLGFDNFRKFRDVTVGANEVRKHQMAQRNQYISSDSIIERILYFYPEMDKDLLIRTVENINQSIRQSERVVILGAVYPDALAVNYQEDMIIMGKMTLIKPITFDFIHDFEDIHENDFVILITITGKYFTIEPSRKHQFKDVLHSALITYESSLEAEFPNTVMVRLPSVPDNEDYNSFLLLFYQLLKHRYYRFIGCE